MSNAIEKAQPQTAMTPFQPAGLEQAMKLADVLSRSALLPSALRNKPGDVLVTLITGHELGLSPMQAIRGMHVIEGKAVMSADLTVALILRSPVCEYFRLVKSTDTVAEYVTKRRGSAEVPHSYTWEQAQKAKLTGKQNWQNHPAAMLRARAAAGLARAVYPDLVLGVYDPDEAQEFTTHTAPPAPVIDPAPMGASDTMSPPENAPVDAEFVEETPAKKLERKIAECGAVEELSGLIPSISALPEADRNVLRPLYAARRTALQANGAAHA